MNQERVAIKTPEFVSLQFQLAGLGSRALAFLIDQLILIVVNIVFFFLLFFIVVGEHSFLKFANTGSFMVALFIIVLFLINYGYFIAFEYFSGGRTIGKRMIGIRVIQENGHSVTLLSSFIRNFLRLIDALPTAYFLGIVMVFFHPKHKRLGDLVAGTIVVHERKAKGNKLSPVEKEIRQRGLTKDYLRVDQWALQSFDAKDWNLVKTYSQRLPQLQPLERHELTKQVADLIFPKFGWDLAGKDQRDLENTLLALYLILREEWEYEL